jgi:putative tricarboxylic transport membrane protein
MMEQSFRQAMTISGGDPKIFVGSVICVIQVILSIVSIFLPVILNRLKSVRSAANADEA